jgi:glycosyltransferase involved in cell wall biosynthesis
MGHLLEKQGVQLAIRALPTVLRRIPEARLKIIGGGRYRAPLEQLAHDLGVASHCDFRGKIEDPRELEDEVARSAVAVAPYVASLDTWTRYADPGKVKTYLACGVPVLVTDVPWNAREIEARGCGRVVGENVDEIAGEIVNMMEEGTNRAMRARAREYAATFGWRAIFAEALA